MSRFKKGDCVAAVRECELPKGWRGIVYVAPGKTGRMTVYSPAETGTLYVVNEWDFYHVLECDSAKERIVIYAEPDSKTVVAVYVCRDEILSSTKVECSPEDTLNLLGCAKLALEHLPKPTFKASPKDNLVDGVYGMCSTGEIFVIVGDNLIYESGSWESVNHYRGDGLFHFIGGYSIDVLVKADSFSHARICIQRSENIIWRRNDIE